MELRDLDEGMDEDVIHVDDLEKPAKEQLKRLKQPLKPEEMQKAEATEEAAEQRVSSSLIIERGRNSG